MKPEPHHNADFQQNAKSLAEPLAEPLTGPLQDAERLSDAMNHLDEELIEEARLARQAQPAETQHAAPHPAPGSRSGKRIYLRWGAAAACLALCLGGGALLLRQNGPGAGQQNPLAPSSTPQTGSGPLVPDSNSASRSDPTPQNHPSGLPLLTITEDSGDAMGFEGYMAYDISELVDANPWTEDAALDTLPVYRNPLKSWGETDTPAGEPYPVTEERFGQMRETLLDVASRLGLTPETLVITDDAPSEEEEAAIREKYADIGEDEIPESIFAPTRLLAEQNGLRLEVEANLTVTIWLDPPLTLPEGYFFGYYNMSYGQAQASAEYLMQQYQGLLAMQQPTINVFMGDYNIYAQQSYSVSYFEGAGSLTEQILHYNFDQIQFYTGEENTLDLIRVFGPDLSDKVGDYPIITASEARQLLLKDHYLTTVPYHLPGEEWIRKVELVYRHGLYDEFFMPFYCFYVELPDEARDNGLKTYGAYYVPAVEGQYLTELPLQPAIFN